MKHVKTSDFGRDHWSVLAYVECCKVDQQPIDHCRIRINVNKHAPVNRPHSPNRWESHYSTRLKGHTKEMPNRIDGHDDWDCIEDLEAEGFLQVISYVNGFFSLTDKGIATAQAIREHKTKGGYFNDFELKQDTETEIEDEIYAKEN